MNFFGATPSKNRLSLTEENLADIIYKGQFTLPIEYGKKEVNDGVGIIVLKNVAINQNFFLGSGLIFKNEIYFNDCIFNDEVEISGLEAECEMQFNNCTFMKAFTLKYARFRDSLWLISNVFKNFMIVQGGQYDEGLLINNNKFLSHFYVADGNFEGEFRIENNTFKDDAMILGGFYKNQFFLSENIFKASFYINGGVYDEHFNFYYNIFRLDVSIMGGVFKSVGIVGGEAFEDFAINGGEFQNEFTIVDGVFKKQIDINNGKFLNSFRFLSGFADSIKFTRSFIGSTYFIQEPVVINSLLFNGIMVRDSIVHINTNCFKLSFIDFKNLGIIYFNDLECRETYFVDSLREINSYENLDVHNCLEIYRSDLGKVIFINCDLSNFQMEFASSKIIDLFLSGTKMPAQIITPNESQQQFGYSQIKKIYEARGDKVEANRYFAREMEAYRATLDGKKNSERWEKLNLWLNKISTNYGQSWERGMLSTLIASGLLFFIYCLSLEIYPSVFYPNVHIPIAEEWVKFSKVISYLPEFINPLRKADYLAEQLLKIKGVDDPKKIEENITSLSRWVEGFSRIAIAYFIYQLIQAFRKHGKSSS